jgi:sulfur-oxidizing protein SoxA
LSATFRCVVIALALAVLSVASARAAEIPLSERKSGYEFMSRQTQAVQDDDAANPGMLWVLDGEALWNAASGGAKKSCADCHAFDPARSQLVDLDGRINICRTEQQKAGPLARESKELLALGAYVGLQSRGMPASVAIDENSKPFLEQGRATFVQRQGQLNLSCAQCHDDKWGQKLAGAPVPQGHATGYPLYRLEWQSLGSLQRRLRNCLFGMRAQSYAEGSQEYMALEFYLMWRARGMKMETPAVRP